MKNKIANILYREGMIAGRLIFASTAEQEAEKVLNVILPDSVFAGKTYAVGGFVRDQLLAEMFPGKTDLPKDLDVVVEMQDGAKKITHFLNKVLVNSDGKSATHSPHQIGKGYPIWSLSFLEGAEGNVQLGGKSYGTAGAVIEFAPTQKESFPDPKTRQRMTTYGSLDDDIKRRDFTVNMLIKDMTTGEIKDLTGVSKADLKSGVLRGHPEVDLNMIFSQDPLRMMRLVRFKVKYGWQIPDSVKDIVKNNINRMNIVSAERIEGELSKIMEYGKLPEAISLMKELDFDKVEVEEEGEELNAISFLLEKLKPLEMRHESPHHTDTDDAKDDKIIDHTMNVVKRVKKTVQQQWAALLHDIGKPSARIVEDEKVKFLKHEEKGLDVAEEILRKFKLKKETIEKVLRLVKNHMRPHSLEKSGGPKALRKFIREMGDDLDDLLDLAKSDSEGKNPPTAYVDKLRKQIEELKNIESEIKVKPVLNGKEVMKILGIDAGPTVGKVTKFILDLQDENPNISKEEATEKIQEAHTKDEFN